MAALHNTSADDLGVGAGASKVLSWVLSASEGNLSMQRMERGGGGGLCKSSAAPEEVDDVSGSVSGLMDHT